MARPSLADFDFELPAGLIAQHPAPERSASRLLDGTGVQPADRVFRDLPALLEPGDLLVFNDTKVIKARLFGHKSTGGAIEILVERVLPGHEAWVHLRASKTPRAGAVLRIAGAFDVEVLGRGGPDDALFRLRFPSDPYALLEAHGHVPLPPYITHADAPDDAARYQTVFAARPGAWTARGSAVAGYDLSNTLSMPRRNSRTAPSRAPAARSAVAYPGVTVSIGPGSSLRSCTRPRARHQNRPKSCSIEPTRALGGTSAEGVPSSFTRPRTQVAAARTRSVVPSGASASSSRPRSSARARLR